MEYAKKYNIGINSVNENFESARIVKPETATEYLRKIWNAPLEIQESFYCLFLNRANEITGHALISLGGLTGTVVDNRIMFKYAVDTLATGIILAHNHPSGQTHPSEPDKRLTKRICKLAELFQINILDHIILTTNSHYSFSEEGLMQELNEQAKREIRREEEEQY